MLAEERKVFEGRKGEGGVDGFGVEGEPFPVLQPGERGKQGRHQGQVGCGVFAGDGSGEEGDSVRVAGFMGQDDVQAACGDQAHKVEVTTEGMASVQEHHFLGGSSVPVEEKERRAAEESVGEGRAPFRSAPIGFRDDETAAEEV